MTSRLARRFALLAACTIGGCGESREALEARKLLDRTEAIPEQGPIEARRAQVTALAALPLVDPHLRATRDACVRLHRALLDAEEAQAEARRLVEAARAPEAPFGPAERAATERWMHRSEEALTRSRALVDPCQEGLLRARRLASTH